VSKGNDPMALEYDLTLVTDAGPGQVAGRAFPGQPTTPWKHLLTIDLYDSHGFEVTIRRDDTGYVGGVGDDGNWEWDHGRSAVSVGFRLSWDRSVCEDTLLVTRAVARVLATGEEDAVFRVNGDTLLLTRLDGVQRKHHRATWWDSGDTTTNEIIPG
jgi:hypothetical protein